MAQAPQGWTRSSWSAFAPFAGTQGGTRWALPLLLPSSGELSLTPCRSASSTREAAVWQQELSPPLLQKWLRGSFGPRSRYPAAPMLCTQPSTRLPAHLKPTLLALASLHTAGNVVERKPYATRSELIADHCLQFKKRFRAWHFFSKRAVSWVQRSSSTANRSTEACAQPRTFLPLNCSQVTLPRTKKRR